MSRALESRFEMFDAFRAAVGAALQPFEKAQDLGSRLLRRWRPSRLARPIVPLVLGNPDLGRQIYRNRFTLAGQSVSGGTASIFARSIVDPAWLIELHGFAWLAHLEAAGSAMYRAYARTLVLDWMESARNLPEEARIPEVAAVRLMALVRHAPFLLKGAGSTFADRFLRLVARDLHDVRRPVSRARRCGRRAQFTSNHFASSRPKEERPALDCARLCVAVHAARSIGGPC
jgi:uncharacterized heparinase superfamily protein